MNLSVPLSAPLAACTLAVIPGATHIRLIPGGEFFAPRGALAGAGPWRLTPAAAERVIAASRSRSADILIDFEHQTLLAAENGKPAPAAGWIDPRSLSYRAEGPEPGLYGAVRWVGDAAALIASEQYRYLSPVFTYDSISGEPQDLLHVALTNFPAIDEPVRAALSARRAASASHSEDIPMDLHTKLLAVLGLPDATDQDQALASVAALKAKADEADSQMAALKSATVPVAVVQQVQAELATLKASRDDDTRAALIDDGLREHKLTQPLADWLRTQPVDAVRGFLAAAPPLAALTGTQTGGKPPAGAGGSTTLSDSEIAVCKAMGITHDEYKKAKEARNGSAD